MLAHVPADEHAQMHTQMDECGYVRVTAHACVSACAYA